MLFCTIRLKNEIDFANDNTKRNQCLELDYEKCLTNLKFWKQMNLDVRFFFDKIVFKTCLQFYLL